MICLIDDDLYWIGLNVTYTDGKSMLSPNVLSMAGRDTW